MCAARHAVVLLRGSPHRRGGTAAPITASAFTRLPAECLKKRPSTPPALTLLVTPSARRQDVLYERAKLRFEKAMLEHESDHVFKSCVAAVPSGGSDNK
eukprot:6486552-Prymnesium_polylepis.1